MPSDGRPLTFSRALRSSCCLFFLQGVEQQAPLWSVPGRPSVSFLWFGFIGLCLAVQLLFSHYGLAAAAPGAGWAYYTRAMGMFNLGSRVDAGGVCPPHFALLGGFGKGRQILGNNLYGPFFLALDWARFSSFSLSFQNALFQ